MSTQLLSISQNKRKLNLQHLQTLKLFFPAILGTIVEYYDYALYGFCASLLAAQFFPIDDSTVALLKTYGIFLTGSLSKPLGSLIFGAIGDRFGRRIALQISMLGIAIPTTVIGLMPTYDQIGWMAPAILLICRIFQGMFTSGESDGVRIFIYESIGKTRPCLANSLSGISCFLGIYLASFACSIFLNLEIENTLWRIPFLIGGGFGIFVFWMRRFLSEPPAFKHYLQTTTSLSRESFLRVLSKNKRIIFGSIIMCGSAGGLYHFYLVFFFNYLSSTLHLFDPLIVSTYTARALLIYILCAPIAGLLADRFGERRLFETSLFAILGIIALNALMLHFGVLSVWLLCLSAGTIAFYSTPGFVMIMKQINMGERYRCLSFGHSVGSMIFSGSAPMISLWLWHSTQLQSAPLLYFAALACMGFLALFLLKPATPSTA